ncbi:hypothetical protein [Burkholderia sp. BCC0419]|uniref:hypothetical protein n=1 Tax=Burkholderia sp. BCC0419 TaxID=486878 RepID=UPI00158C5F5B|nr:hypothetical protein [Burkholderia sp. BCC0419]
MLSTILNAFLGDGLIVHELRLPQDILAIIHDRVGAVGQMGEVSGAALALRIERAEFGYIESVARIC